MVLRAKKIPQARLKINKKNVMVMFESMNATNTYYIQLINAHAHQKRRSSVR